MVLSFSPAAESLERHHEIQDPEEKQQQQHKEDKKEMLDEREVEQKSSKNT